MQIIKEYIIQERKRRRERDSPTELVGFFCPWLLLKQQIDKLSAAARTNRSRTGHLSSPPSRTAGRSWEMATSNGFFQPETYSSTLLCNCEEKGEDDEKEVATCDTKWLLALKCVDGGLGYIQGARIRGGGGWGDPQHLPSAARNQQPPRHFLDCDLGSRNRGSEGEEGWGIRDKKSTASATPSGLRPRFLVIADQRGRRVGGLSGTIIRGTLKTPNSQLVTLISIKLQRPDGYD